MAGTQNVILATLSSQIHNARPEDVKISDHGEILQAGLNKPSYISTSFLVTLNSSDLTRLCGTLFERTHQRIKTRLPPMINIAPIAVLIVIASRKKIAAKIIANATLNLSTGATFETSPTESALK